MAPPSQSFTQAAPVLHSSARHTAAGSGADSHVGATFAGLGGGRGNVSYGGGGAAAAGAGAGAGAASMAGAASSRRLSDFDIAPSQLAGTGQLSMAMGDNEALRSRLNAKTSELFEVRRQLDRALEYLREQDLAFSKQKDQGHTDGAQLEEHGKWYHVG